jgi:hypothetical protein
MINVKDVYHEEYWYDYNPMIQEFGKVVIKIDDDDYQGDSRVLYHLGKVGYLNFGWGSCSGCDALQACDSIEEVQELANELEQDIIWFDCPENALKYFEEHDWEGDYTWHEKEQCIFIETVKCYLKEVLS